MTGWLHHIDVTVSDLTRATEFYGRVLPLVGFRRTFDVPEGPIFAGEKFELGLVAAKPDSVRPHDRYSPGLHHLAFGVVDRTSVDRVHEELKVIGATILDPPAAYERYAPGYYAVFFADPDGIKLEVVFTPEWPSNRT